MIESSKRDFEREKKLYAEFIVRQYANQGDEEPALDAKFVQTPDLKKPLFMDKVTSELLADSLKREEIAKNAAQALKAQVNRLEREKRDAWKARESRQAKQEIATLKNLKDPKHLAKLTRRKKRKQKKSR
jgi:hypothetical protein